MNHTIRNLALGASLALVAGCSVKLDALRGRGSTAAPVAGTSSTYKSPPGREHDNTEPPKRSVEPNASPIGGVFVIEPGFGVATVPPMVPTWCDVVKSDPEIPVNWSFSRVKMLAEHRGNELGNTRTVAMLLCADPTHEEVRAQTGYLVQFWVNQTGASPELMVAFLRMAAEPGRLEAVQAAHCRTHPGVRGEGLGDVLRCRKGDLGALDDSGGLLGPSYHGDAIYDATVVEALIAPWSDEAKVIGRMAYARMLLLKARGDAGLEGMPE